MTKGLDSKKIALIQQITAIQSEEELDEFLNQLKINKLSNEFGNIFNATKKSISLESLKENYLGFDRKGFDKIVNELNIEEPLDELLEMLD